MKSRDVLAGNEGTIVGSRIPDYWDHDPQDNSRVNATIAGPGAERQLVVNTATVVTSVQCTAVGARHSGHLIRAFQATVMVTGIDSSFGTLMSPGPMRRWRPGVRAHNFASQP